MASRGQTFAASTVTIDAINAAIESVVTAVLTKNMPGLLKQAFRTPCAHCRAARGGGTLLGRVCVFANNADDRSTRAGLSSRRRSG
jgi:hypothetical protein